MRWRIWPTINWTPSTCACSMKREKYICGQSWLRPPVLSHTDWGLTGALCSCLVGATWTYHPWASEEHLQVNMSRRSQNTSANRRRWFPRYKALPMLQSEHLHQNLCKCWLYSCIENRDWVAPNWSSGSTWCYITGLSGHLEHWNNLQLSL